MADINRLMDKDLEEIDIINSKIQVEEKITNEKLDTLDEVADSIKLDTTSIKNNQTNKEQFSKILTSFNGNIGGTMQNQLMVAQHYRLTGGVFNGTTLDTNFYTSSITANATGAITNGTVALTTTADSGSAILVYANSLARYMGANMNYSRHILRVSDLGKTANKRQWGVFNGPTFTDGFFFQLSGTTLSIVSRTGGEDAVVTSFNGEDFTLDTNAHKFEIFYTNIDIKFAVDNVTIHTLTETTTRICATRHFKPFLYNINTGVGSVCSLYCEAMTISRYGAMSTQGKTYLQEGTTAGVLLKYGTGSIHLMNISGVVNNAVATLYDGLNTEGKKLWTSGSMTNQTVPFFVSLDSSGGTPFETGLFLTVTVANCNVFVKYE